MAQEFEWQAKWIWAGEEDAQTSRHHYFRQTFMLEESEGCAGVLRICADTRYRLWLNGRFLGHGPARAETSTPFFDSYEISDLLKEGTNTLAVLVTHYGMGTCFSRLGSPGLLVQTSVHLASGESVIVGSDANWKTLPAPYATCFPRMSIQLPCPEVFDARQEPVNWNLPGFDDQNWQAAREIGPVGIEPWLQLIPREIPLPSYRPMTPVAIVQVNEVELTAPPRDPFLQEIEGEELPAPAMDMEAAVRLVPAPAESVTWRHPALFTVTPQSGTKGVSVVLDFGREVSGFPLIITRQGAGGRLDIGYSERIEADGTVNPNRWGGCDVHYADRLYLRPGFQRHETLDHRAFRYIRLDIYDNPEPLEILVEFSASGYPVTYQGSFQCSDALLQRIWEVSRYTTELCMDDGFMDTPWRERGQWLADARVEALAAAYTFGDTALARNALAQYPQSQEESGWFRGLFPSDPPFETILPTFCFLWPVALWDYFLLTADSTLLSLVWPNIERLVTAIQNATDDEGLLSNLPGWVFVDWAPLNTAGQSTAVNALAYDALRCAAKIARVLGVPNRGGELEFLADDIRESLNDLLWDNAKGLYRDGIVNGEVSEVYSEQANVLAALNGIADVRQKGRILSALDAGQATVPIATPYFAFYFLRLLYREGRHEQALAYTREHWGKMLERGATTFWEQWEPHWSQCHAWSACPAYDLPAEIGGIRPLQPGFEEFSVEIKPAHLTWFRTTVPTPHGNIVLNYHYRTDVPAIDPMNSPVPLSKTSPALTVHLVVPTGTLAYVSVPLRNVDAPTITVNGKTIWEKGSPLPAHSRYRRENDCLTFSASGGRYHIEFERAEVL